MTQDCPSPRLLAALHFYAMIHTDHGNIEAVLYPRDHLGGENISMHVGPGWHCNAHAAMD